MYIKFGAGHFDIQHGRMEDSNTFFVMAGGFQMIKGDPTREPKVGGSDSLAITVPNTIDLSEMFDVSQD